MIVPAPTAPNVNPLSSLSGDSAIPANSTLTYRRIPLLSLGSLPPNHPFTFVPASSAMPPSIGASPKFVGALPIMSNPPQSPRSLLPAITPLVNTIGLVGVPSAIILPPRLIHSADVAPTSPIIIVPGSIVRVAPLATKTIPLSPQILFAVNVLLAVIVPWIYSSIGGGFDTTTDKGPTTELNEGSLISSTFNHNVC